MCMLIIDIIPIVSRGDINKPLFTQDRVGRQTEEMSPPCLA